MSTIWAIARKEFYHILRDARSLTIVLAMPILMTILYGSAINLDLKNVRLVVQDHDDSRDSRALVDRFAHSPYFSLVPAQDSYLAPEELFRTGEATAVLFIARGFADKIAANQQTDVGIWVDGSDNNAASSIQNYAAGVVQLFNLDRNPPGVSPPIITVSSQTLYNPNLESAQFFVPGLVAILLIMVSALLTSITIAREKETGTLEQLLTAPVTSFQVLTGKILPYVLVALIDGIIVLVVARIVFAVPLVGSELLLLGTGLIYIITALSLGILISTLVTTQQVAMMLAITITVLPSVMLSGFVFAIKNFPLPLQITSHIIPARYFVAIIRAITIKGAGLAEVYPHVLGMCALTLVLGLSAAIRFKPRIG